MPEFSHHFGGAGLITLSACLLFESRMRRMTQMTQIVVAESDAPVRDIRGIFRIRDSDRCPMRGQEIRGIRSLRVFHDSDGRD